MRLIARALVTAVLAISANVALIGADPCAAQDAPREADKVWPYLAALPTEQRRAAMEREAAREGALVLYGATGIDRAGFWINEFNKRHPRIKVEFVRLQAGELYDKIATERRTGRVRADLIITTITYVELLAAVNAFAPYETVHWADFDPRFTLGGAAKGWTAVVYEIFPHAFAWRSDRIAAAEAPKSFAELADPKWKGRAGTTTHLEDFLNGAFTVLGEDKGRALAKSLGALNNRLFRSHAALSDALAAGQVDLAWGLVAGRPIELQAKGAPVAWNLGDPQFAEGNTISIGRDTDKPYAAALFLDTMLAAETLAASDAWQGGRIFGNRKGKYALSLDQYPSLFIFPPLSRERYRELNRLAEEIFVR